ncbi:Transcriptional regulator, GntR family domain / Aspartate aminotransferase [Minicystis rosea]|nr:Transcriptional regulator, GntR family domain / Aspartate aminotransferase [Minicystis rosea]
MDHVGPVEITLLALVGPSSVHHDWTNSRGRDAQHRDHARPFGGEPLYKQIFDQVVTRVRSRAFPPGYRLPPTRALAEELGTNRNTVVRAYADLEAAGFVTSAVGRGTFIAEGRALPAPLAAPAGGSMPWSSLLSTVASVEPLRRGERFGRTPSGRDVVNLSRMQPSPDLLPDDLIRRCTDHVLRTEGPGALGYAPPDGLPRLRELIAADLALSGVPAKAADILVTTGSQQGLDLVARALVNPGDAFLVDQMTYPGALNLLSLAGARLVPIPSDGEGPDLAALHRVKNASAKGFYLMPNCRNPTGTSISAARRRALVAWSHEAGVPLVEDDYGADLSLDGAPPPPALRALDGDVIHLGTFSKKLVPALRVGFLVCPEPLRRVLSSIKNAMDLGTSVLLQHVLAEFLERGYLRAHLNRTLPAYRARRDALDASLREHLPSGVRWHRPERGVVLWLALPRDLEPEAVFEEASRRGVLVGPSPFYEVDARIEPGLRLTFCAEPEKRLAEGGRRLGEAMRALAKQRGRGRRGADLFAV